MICDICKPWLEETAWKKGKEMWVQCPKDLFLHLPSRQTKYLCIYEGANENNRALIFGGFQLLSLAKPRAEISMKRGLICTVTETSSYPLIQSKQIQSLH